MPLEPMVFGKPAATLEQLNGINVLTYDLHNTNEVWL